MHNAPSGSSPTHHNQARVQIGSGPIGSHVLKEKEIFLLPIIIGLSLTHNMQFAADCSREGGIIHHSLFIIVVVVVVIIIG